MQKKYRVLKCETSIDLEGIVDQYLTEGWQCQGGVCVAIVGGQVYYHQSMVKIQSQVDSLVEMIASRNAKELMR